MDGLIEFGIADGIVTGGLRYLLAAQDSSGGWAEVPGHRPTISNTCQALSPIRAAQRAGIDVPEINDALDRARAWLWRATGRRPPASIFDHAYAVRIASKLDLVGDERFQRLARQLCDRLREFLDPAVYADTAHCAIALTEAFQSVDSRPDSEDAWPWRWQLPNAAPPFLAPGPYFYELLYGAVKARWWVRAVDALTRWRVINHAAGLVLGAVTSVGLISDYVVNALTAGDTRRGTFAVAAIAIALLIWFVVKAAAGSSWGSALRTSAASLCTAAVVGLVLDPYDQVFPTLVALIGLRWLVIDVVAFTADSTGLLNRLLPSH